MEKSSALTICMKLKKFGKQVLLLVSPLFIAACSAFRNDVDTLIPEPLASGIADVEAAKAVTVAEPPILELNRALSLADILGISLQYQKKTSRALAAARSSGYQYKSSLSNYYPVISGQVSYLIDDLHIDPPGSIPPTSTGTTAINTASTTSNGTFYSVTESLALSYLLLDFGGRDATACAAWHFFQESGLLYIQSVQDVLIDALQAYFNYINAYESLLSAKANLDNAQHSYDIAYELYKAKYATVLDVQQLKTSILQNEIQMRTLEGQVKVTHGALAFAMGIQTSVPFETQTLPLDLFPADLEENIEDLMHAALVLKPNLAAYREEYLKRQSEIRIVQSAGSPTFNTLMTTAHTDFANGPTKTINESTIAFNVNIPIFQGFFFVNQLRAKKADRDFAFFDWRLKEEAAMLDVWSNYYTFLTAKSNLEIAKKLVESTLAAYDAALELYRLQQAGIQDLLTAQNDLANARLLIVQIKINMASSLSSLAYSIGIINPNLNMYSKNG